MTYNHSEAEEFLFKKEKEIENAVDSAAWKSGKIKSFMKATGVRTLMNAKYGFELKNINGDWRVELCYFKPAGKHEEGGFVDFIISEDKEVVKRFIFKDKNGIRYADLDMIKMFLDDYEAIIEELYNIAKKD